MGVNQENSSYEQDQFSFVNNSSIMPRRTYSPEIEALIAEQEARIKKDGIRFLRCMFSSMAGTYYCMEENASLVCISTHLTF